MSTTSRVCVKLFDGFSPRPGVEGTESAGDSVRNTTGGHRTALGDNYGDRNGYGPGDSFSGAAYTLVVGGAMDGGRNPPLPGGPEPPTSPAGRCPPAVRSVACGGRFPTARIGPIHTPDRSPLGIPYDGRPEANASQTPPNSCAPAGTRSARTRPREHTLPEAWHDCVLKVARSIMNRLDTLSWCP